MRHTVRCALCKWQRTVTGPEAWAAQTFLDHYTSTHQEKQ